MSKMQLIIAALDWAVQHNTSPSELKELLILRQNISDSVSAKDSDR